MKLSFTAASLIGMAAFVAMGLAAGPDLAQQTLYVTNNNNTIEEITPDGVGAVFASDDGTGNVLSAPRGLAFDSAGNLFVANSGIDTIEKFTPGGAPSLFVSGINAHGLIFDSADSLYAAASGAAIEEITPSGVATTFADSNPDQPYDLAFDNAGNLYAANYDSGFATGDIEKFTPRGASTIFANTGNVVPYGLAIDSTGNLYVDESNGTLKSSTPAVSVLYSLTPI